MQKSTGDVPRGMRTASFRVSSLAFCLLVAAAPSPGQGLRVDGAPAALATLLARARAASPCSREPRATAEATLARLRLGDPAGAAALWAAPIDGPDAAQWDAIAHFWYLRATGDAATVRARWPRLRRGFEQTVADADPPPSFAAGALQAHARFAFAALGERLGEPTGATQSWRERALQVWLELERQTWQPGRGHYRPLPTDGALRLPERPDDSVLAPAAAGWLVATGDRFECHLRSALPALLAAPVADARAAAWQLAAAAQLGERAHLDAAWQRLPFDVRNAAHGAVLDAALFALTGLRLATGAGVDEHGVRLRPWLPPDVPWLRCDDLRGEGASLDLELTVRSGALEPDELGEAALASTVGSRRLRATVHLRATVDQRPRTVLLQGPTATYVVPMQPGDRITRSLPCP